MKKKHYVTLIKWALFVIYMILLFYVVFFAEGMGRAEIASGYKYNLTLFTEIRRYWRYLGHFDSLGWIAFLNIIGNVLAFRVLSQLCARSSYARISFWHCRGAPRELIQNSQFVQARLRTFHDFSHRCSRKKAR